MLQKNISKNRNLELFLSLLFIFPYVETGIIYQSLQITAYGSMWRAALTMEVCLCIFFSLNTYRFKEKNALYRRLNIFSFFLSFEVLFSAFFGNGLAPALTLALMIIIPMINAYYIFELVTRRNIDVSRVIKMGVYLFVAFVIFSIIFNIQKYGTTFSLTDSTARLSASGGGPVIYGYTISLVLAFTIINRDVFSILSLLICVPILIVGILLTQDRGAFIVIVLTFIYLFKENKAFFLIVLLFVIFFGYGSFTQMQVVGRAEGGIFQDARVLSLFSSIYSMIDDKVYLVFGHGLNGFFPYQHWQLTTTGTDVFEDAEFNLFNYNGIPFLVQPHNSYIYIFMELGLVGLFFFISIIVMFTKRLFQNKKTRLIALSFLIVSFLESALILEPTTCCLWYLMLVLSEYRLNTNVKPNKALQRQPGRTIIS